MSIEAMKQAESVISNMSVDSADGIMGADLETLANAATALREGIAAAEAQSAEPVGIVRAKFDYYGGTFVHWTQMPVAGMKLYAHPALEAATTYEQGFEAGQAAPRVPMTEQEMYGVLVSICVDGSAPSFADFTTEAELIKYSRGLEAHHHIGVAK